MPNASQSVLRSSSKTFFHSADLPDLLQDPASSASKNKRTLSLAMTIYNGEEFLRIQLDSIRTQKLRFDQVVLVDDASDDSSCQMVEAYIAQYALKGWQLIRHAENEGFVSAFRDALAACSGDLIFLCDQDDIWYPEKSEVMAKEFQAHPTLMCLASSFDLVDEKGEKINDKTRAGRMNHNLIRRSLPAGAFSWMNYDDIAGYNISPGCTLAITRALQQMYLQTPPDMNLPHDWALVAIAAMNDGLGYLDIPLMGYRQHAHNTLGLTRRSVYVSRLQAARQDYAQKKALQALASSSCGSKESLQKIIPVANFFEERLHALESRSVFELGTLLVAPQFAGFRLTISMDIKTVLTDRSSSENETLENLDPASRIAPKPRGRKNKSSISKPAAKEESQAADDTKPNHPDDSNGADDPIDPNGMKAGEKR